MPHQISIIILVHLNSRPCKVHVKYIEDNNKITYNVLSLPKIKDFIIRPQPQHEGD